MTMKFMFQLAVTCQLRQIVNNLGITTVASKLSGRLRCTTDEPTVATGAVAPVTQASLESYLC